MREADPPREEAILGRHNWAMDISAVFIQCGLWLSVLWQLVKYYCNILFSQLGLYYCEKGKKLTESRCDSAMSAEIFSTAAQAAQVHVHYKNSHVKLLATDERRRSSKICSHISLSFWSVVTASLCYTYTEKVRV